MSKIGLHASSEDWLREVPIHDPMTPANNKINRTMKEFFFGYLFNLWPRDTFDAEGNAGEKSSLIVSVVEVRALDINLVTIAFISIPAASSLAFSGSMSVGENKKS